MESAPDLNIYSFSPVAPIATVMNKYKWSYLKRQLERFNPYSLKQLFWVQINSKCSFKHTV